MDDSDYRNRLLIYTLVRLSGLIVFFLGLAIIYTNLLRPGGWPQVGAIVVILGVLDAMLAPRFLKMFWDRRSQ